MNDEDRESNSESKNDDDDDDESEDDVFGVTTVVNIKKYQVGNNNIYHTIYLGCLFMKCLISCTIDFGPRFKKVTMQ